MYKKGFCNNSSETGVFIPLVANAIDATKTLQSARFRRTLLCFTDDDERVYTILWACCSEFRTADVYMNVAFEDAASMVRVCKEDNLVLNM
jgi:hypothetical protein